MGKLYGHRTVASGKKFALLEEYSPLSDTPLVIIIIIIIIIIFLPLSIAHLPFPSCADLSYYLLLVPIDLFKCEHGAA